MWAVPAHRHPTGYKQTAAAQMSLALHLVSVRASGPSINHVVAIGRRGSGVNRTDHADIFQANCVCPQ